MRFNAQRICLVVVIALSVAAYLNALRNPFVYDDQKQVLDNAALAAGFDIPAPDHTAAGDVATLQAAFLTLRDYYVDHGLFLPRNL